MELPRNLIKGLIEAGIIGDKSHNAFVQERLVEEKKSFDPINNFQLNTGLQSKKAKPKALSVVKEDRQAFEVMLGTNTDDLSEALKYPITTAPLSIAKFDHTLRRGSNGNLRNFIVNESQRECTYKRFKVDF